ncbi:MAG: glycine zipper family protein [Pseudomonadota bacterium]
MSDIRKSHRLTAIAIVAATGSVLAGCASSGAKYAPIVDGPAGPTYEADLQDCQQLAETRNYDNADTRTDAGVGAGIGAAIGALDGSLAEAAAGAVVGGLFGAGEGAMETRGERKEIVITCMRGRGHKVVG